MNKKIWQIFDNVHKYFAFLYAGNTYKMYRKDAIYRYK